MMVRRVAIMIPIVIALSLLCGCITFKEPYENGRERKRNHDGNDDDSYPLDRKMLVAYYQMDDDWSYGTTKDSSGIGSDGEILGGAIQEPVGVFGKAAKFDGIDDLIWVHPKGPLDLNGYGLTMMAWVKVIDDSEENMIMDNEESYEFRISNGDVCFAIRAEGSDWYWIRSEAKVTIGTWQHVAVTYDGTCVRTYIDGESKDVVEYPHGHILPSELPFSIGAGLKYDNTKEGWKWDYPFHGSLDEVAVFSFALTEDEIAAMAYDQALP